MRWTVTPRCVCSCPHGRSFNVCGKKDFWHPDGIRILRRAAREVLAMYDPERRGYITVDDLVSEAWLRSFRHGKIETLGKQLIWSKLAMKRAYKELVFNRPHAKTGRLAFRPLPEFELEKKDGAWFVHIYDLADCIMAHCTARQAEAVFLRGLGNTLDNTGKLMGVTQQNVTCLIGRARKHMVFEIY